MADTYKRAAAYLTKHAILKPEVGIICGSGLSGLSDGMTDTQVFNYNDIPGFPKLTVAGHVGELVFGKLEGVPTVCMKGRFHFYEGHPMELVVMPVRAMRCIGVKVLIVTTASGGLRPDWNVGDVTCIMDHFSLPGLVGVHPLMGPNDSALGPRFMPTSNAYCKRMQEVVMKSGESLGFDFMREGGCHAYVSGPTYESPTEAKWLRQLGVSSVSMSTIPEIMTAHHCGMKVIGLALLTNKALMPGDTHPAASHQEVLETVEKRAKQMTSLAERIVRELKPDLDAMEDLPKIDFSNAKAKAPKDEKKAKGKSGVDYSGLEKGLRVQVDSGGVWYTAEVVTVSTSKARAKAPVKVHFQGYAADYDEWVGDKRIRSKAVIKS